jgi:hypothetical protein
MTKINVLLPYFFLTYGQGFFLINGLRYLIQPRSKKLEDVKSYGNQNMKKKGKDEQTHLLLLAIQWNGVEDL